VRSDGTRSKTHVFRIVLSYSRKAYSEVVLRQTTDAFLRAIENAFWHFGGVPRRLVLDNLRAAVKKADWFEPELNPKVEAFAAQYGFVFAPTRPYLPRHKGKVERGVGYVQDNALKKRTFGSLAEEQMNIHTSAGFEAPNRGRF
jgi:transposase